MQTFLPYPDFAESARVLDSQRLGKQRVETMQIMKTLLLGGGWQHHPAVAMWRGYEAALYEYQSAVVFEWVCNRGYKDTCLEKTREVLWLHRDSAVGPRPPWFGDVAFHRAHQSNLIRKNPAHYGPLFPGVPDDLPYIWPVPTREETPA